MGGGINSRILYQNLTIFQLCFTRIIRLISIFPSQTPLSHRPSTTTEFTGSFSFISTLTISSDAWTRRRHYRCIISAYFINACRHGRRWASICGVAVLIQNLKNTNNSLGIGLISGWDVLECNSRVFRSRHSDFAAGWESKRIIYRVSSF